MTASQPCRISSVQQRVHYRQRKFSEALGCDHFHKDHREFANQIQVQGLWQSLGVSAV